MTENPDAGLIKRLREPWNHTDAQNHEAMTEAASLIEAWGVLSLVALSHENRRLREQLAELQRCSFGGEYGRCTLETGHHGRHHLKV